VRLGDFEGLDGLDDPYIPKVGELYLVAKEILGVVDIHPKRPAVVIEVPADLNGRIHVVTRTTDMERPGVPHAAVASDQLDQPGVFGYLRSAAAIVWKRPYVEYLGVLGDEILSAVLEWFA
jgi:hypothetical protein